MNLVTGFAAAEITQVTGATNSIGASLFAPLSADDKGGRGGQGGGGGSQRGQHLFQEVALWLPDCSPEFLRVFCAIDPQLLFTTTSLRKIMVLHVRIECLHDVVNLSTSSKSRTKQKAVDRHL